MKKVKESAKAEYGRQLRKYRETIGLSQKQFAFLTGTAEKYISHLERGMVSMGLDNLEKLAAFFGITYYQMGNPDFPIPTLPELPSQTRHAVEALKKKAEAAAREAERQKAEDKKAGKPGRSELLKGLIPSGFFSQPRTSREVFFKLYPDLKNKRLTVEQQMMVGSITGILSRVNFARFLDKIGPDPGSNIVRFVEKGKGD